MPTFIEKFMSGTHPSIQAGLPFIWGMFNAGRYRETLEAAQSLLRSGSHPMLLNIAAMAAMEQRELKTAEALWTRAIREFPRDSGAYINLGNLLAQRNDLGRADQLYRDAIAIDQRSPDARYNLGNLLSGQRRFEDAIEQYSEALRFAEGRADIHNSLGCALSELKVAERASVHLNRAVEIAPDYAQAWMNLGLLYRDLGKLDAAAVAFGAAARLGGETEASALCELAMIQSSSCQWRQVEVTGQRLLTLIRSNAGGDVMPFITLALPGFSGADHKRAAQMHADAILSRTPETIQLAAPTARASKKMRVGLLSADLHEHATAYLLAGVLENRDTEHCETFLYSYGPLTNDPMQQRLIDACESFVDVSTIADHAAAARIATDSIDVLVDLKGYTKHERPGISALRPAPVIVSWLGYPGSLGHRRMADYVIGDAIVTPQGSEEDFAETIVRMPVTYQPTDASRPSAPPAKRQDHGLPENALVLCCFNQAYKITEERARTWFRVMAAVPTSYLWLLDMPCSARSALLGLAETEGVAASRVLWAPHVPQAQHIARLSLVDLALDTFPYTSHTTASDALWAGVPLVTRIGESMASRVAASVLSAAGMDDLIVRDEEAYQAAVIGMLQNRDRLAEARRAAVQARESRLFDTASFATDLYTQLLTLKAPAI